MTSSPTELVLAFSHEGNCWVQMRSSNSDWIYSPSCPSAEMWASWNHGMHWKRHAQSNARLCVCICGQTLSSTGWTWLTHCIFRSSNRHLHRGLLPDQFHHVLFQPVWNEVPLNFSKDSFDPGVLYPNHPKGIAPRPQVCRCIAVGSTCLGCMQWLQTTAARPGQNGSSITSRPSRDSESSESSIHRSQNGEFQNAACESKINEQPLSYHKQFQTKW